MSNLQCFSSQLYDLVSLFGTKVILFGLNLCMKMCRKGLALSLKQSSIRRIQTNNIYTHRTHKRIYRSKGSKTGELLPLTLHVLCHN